MYAGSMDTLLYNAPYAVQEAMVQWAIDANCARYDMGESKLNQLKMACIPSSVTLCAKEQSNI
ncbi:hypothetical protein [Enterococcus bulliens]